MSLIDDYSEPVELVDNKGIPYGEIQAIFLEMQFGDIAVIGDTPINDYDIIRRKSNGETFRLFNLRRSVLPNGALKIITATLSPYRLWQNKNN